MPHTIREERTRVATTLARRRHHHGDRRRRSGDAPARPARAEGARPAARSSRPDVHGPQGAEPMTGTGRLTRAQAHRLIETYGYSGPRTPAVDRLTTAEPFIFDAPAPRPP